MVLLKCSRAHGCLLPWEERLKLIIEIWTGVIPFSFLTARWFHISMLSDILNFGLCPCIPFDCLSVASLAKNERSIRFLRAFNMRCFTYKLSYTVHWAMDFDSVKKREITQFDFMPPMQEYNYITVIMKTILEYEYLLTQTPASTLVVREAIALQRTPASVGNALNALLKPKTEDRCMPCSRENCSCNLFIHVLQQYSFNRDIYMPLITNSSVIPELCLRIGYDVSQLSKHEILARTKPKLFISLHFDDILDAYFIQVLGIPAHSKPAFRQITLEMAINSNNMFRDLRRMFFNPKLHRLFDFLCVFFPSHRQNMVTEQGRPLMQHLAKFHPFFQPVPTLKQLCKQTINRNLKRIDSDYVQALRQLGLPDPLRRMVTLRT